MRVGWSKMAIFASFARYICRTLKSVSGSATNGLASLRLSDKTVRKFAELPIYCQRQKCSPGNVVSGSIRFMLIFARVRWRGGIK